MEIPGGIEFYDPRGAARNLGRIRYRLPPEAFDAICHFLADSPDPDLAVVLLDRLAESVSDALLSAISTKPSLIHYAILIFGHSTWLGAALVQDSDILQRFEQREGLERSFSSDEFRERFGAGPGTIQEARVRADTAERPARHSETSGDYGRGLGIVGRFTRRSLASREQGIAARARNSTMDGC